MNIEPFNPKPQCVKCGSRNVIRLYRWHQDERWIYGPCKTHPNTEHHDVICQLCRYEWIEAVKPQEQSE